MDNQAIIITVAYNAEKTIRRAINSLLNQTYTNWIYYVFDNGSSDDTKKIIESYETNDKRIISMGRFDNNIWSFFEILPRIVGKHDDNAWFATLDADDEYEPTFLEYMIMFAEKNNLDIAACGSLFIDSETMMVKNARNAKNDLLISEQNLSELFPIYHQFLRTIWGKIYKMSLVKNTHFDSEIFYKMGYGADTYFVVNVLKKAARFGILSASLHKYYLSLKSASYIFNSARFASDIILYDDAIDFLRTKIGFVSKHNAEFLLCVYMNAIIDTFNVLLNSNISDRDKLDNLYEMFLCEYTIKLATYENLGALINNLNCIEQRKNLFTAAVNWLFTQNEVDDEQVEKYCKLGEFLCAANENADGWIFFNKLFIQFLFEQNRNDEALQKLNELSELLPNDEEIQEMKKKQKKI